MTEYYCKDCQKTNGLEKKFKMQLHKCKYCNVEKVCYVDAPMKDFGGKKK